MIFLFLEVILKFNLFSKELKCDYHSKNFSLNSFHCCFYFLAPSTYLPSSRCHSTVTVQCYRYVHFVRVHTVHTQHDLNFNIIPCFFIVLPGNCFNQRVYMQTLLKILPVPVNPVKRYVYLYTHTHPTLVPIQKHARIHNTMYIVGSNTLF